MTRARDPVGRLLDLALPPACAGCGAEGAADLRRLPARRSARGSTCPPGRRSGSGRARPIRCSSSSGARRSPASPRRALHALKYAGERRLAEPLGEAVAARWRRGGRRRRRSSSRSPSTSAAPASAATTRPRCSPRSRRRELAPARGRARSCAPARPTAQYRLDRRHRADNVADAFAVAPAARRAIAGRWVVLVDDVVTTGATLSEAAEALLDAGAAAVSAIDGGPRAMSRSGHRADDDRSPWPPAPRAYTRTPSGPASPARPPHAARRRCGAGRSAVRTIVRGKNLEVPDRVREYAERKLSPPRAPPG